MEKTKKPPMVSFSHFLEKFPVVELPITLAEEAHHAFSLKNDPLPALMIEQFILPLEVREVDDYTEFIPCMRIPDTQEFHAIIYWRAGLLNYQYTLACFTKKGELIDKRVIAGTFSDGQALTASVATIDEDWIISVVSGEAGAGQKLYDPSSSTAYQLELLPEGRIVNVSIE
ncbi:MAG: hypothetical protein H6557_11415 [Lewinellaceae bacterium]|nr:hypothetical protein [Phaeodactylibacter sp.]MCB9037220.1 hypothetical protein [Lewinellaceae bacterium]